MALRLDWRNARFKKQRKQVRFVARIEFEDDGSDSLPVLTAEFFNKVLRTLTIGPECPIGPSQITARERGADDPEGPGQFYDCCGDCGCEEVEPDID